MTMEIELAKRDFVAQLWEETRHDKAARELIFGEVLEGVSIDPPSELRETVREEMMEDPPDDLREKVESDLLDDPPEALIERVTDLLIEDPPDRLVERIKDSLRESVEEEFSDEIEDLRMEIAKLRGKEYEPPKVPKTTKPKRGKVRR